MVKQYNQLPSPTFSWLDVNGTEREAYENPAEQISISAADGPAVRKDIRQSTDLVIRGGTSPLLAVMHLHGGGMNVRTTVHAGAGEQLKLVQIFTGGALISEVQAELAENASLELVQIDLDCADAVSGAAVNLNGRNAAFTSYFGYQLSGSHKLDINLNMVQYGKKTRASAEVKGVLRGQADKLFRGTIDFRKGASGSAGTEREEVLLLDETVRNRTVPVILCAEDDVAGSHGATIGRIDPAQIFYMQSRGVPETEIYEILAWSKLSSIIRQIGDAETEQAVKNLLGRGETE